MTRILLIVEDYNENSFLQLLLKKLGFDVEVNNNPVTVVNTVLSFQPQIVFITAKGKKINGLKVALDIKKNKNSGKLVFIKKAGQDFADKLFQDGAIDGIVGSPITPPKLIHLVSELSGVDTNELVEKYKRIVAQQNSNLGSSEESIMVKGGGESSKEETSLVGDSSANQRQINYEKFHSQNLIEDSERKLKYNNFVKNMDLPAQKSLQKNKIKEFNAQLRADQDPKEIEESQKSKMEFVDALFAVKKK